MISLFQNCVALPMVLAGFCAGGCYTPRTAHGVWSGRAHLLRVYDKDGREYSAVALDVSDGPAWPDEYRRPKDPETAKWWRKAPQPVLLDWRQLLLDVPGVREGDPIRVEGETNEMGYGMGTQQRVKVTRHYPRMPAREEAVRVKRYWLRSQWRDVAPGRMR